MTPQLVLFWTFGRSNGTTQNVPSTSGSAKLIMSWGKISGTPPTLVETTYKPAQAASRIAIPKDSVNDVFMKINPRDKTYDPRLLQRFFFG
jgi:hypothetical protein